MARQLVDLFYNNPFAMVKTIAFNQPRCLAVD